MHDGDNIENTTQDRKQLHADELIFDGEIERLIEIGGMEEVEEILRDNQARYHVIVEDQTEFITRFLPDGTLTFVNQAACRYVGKTHNELIGHNIRPYILEKDRETLFNQLASLNPECPVCTAECRILRPDNNIRWLQWTGRALYDKEDNLLEYQATGRDITEVKELQIRTEQMLSEITKQSDSLRSLIENMPAGVVLLDSDLNVVYANDAFVAYFDKSGNQTSSTCIDHLLLGAEECGVVALIQRAFQQHRPVRVHDLRYEGIDGKEVYWSGSIVPIRLQSGESVVSGVAMITVDVTEEITARKRLAELATLAERRAADIETERIRLNTIIQSTPVALVVCDTDWRIVAYNDAADNLGTTLGMNKENNLHWADGLELLDEDYQPLDLINTPIGRSLLGEACTGEIMHCRSASRINRTLSVNSTPLRSMDGQISGVVAAFTDITDQLHAQKHIQDIYHREHAIAEKLQGCFLPREFPNVDGFEIGQIYQPALDEALVGGDFYDIFELDDGEYGVVIADVAGKGLNAAVYTSMTKYMLRAYALSEKSPELVLAKLNEALNSCTPIEVFVTLVYGVLDTNTKTFTYANAGHEQPLYQSRKNRMLASLDSTGRALALLPGSDYTVKTINLCPDDVLLFYTDGITDAGSGPNRFEQERAISVMESNASCSAGDLAKAMLNSALEFGSGKLTDDAAMIVIRVKD